MYTKASDKNKEEYKNILQAIGAFSYLFSESDNIYLNYRVHENSYCEAFGANNLSRADIAIDAEKDKIGIGLKTFLRSNDNTYQKIAEFNKLSIKLNGKSGEEAVELIKKWRNERLQTSINLYSLDSLMYHCIIRDSEGLHVFEEEMNFINEIENIEEDDKTIKFSSLGEEYNYNKSKSTLLKRFNTREILDTFEIEAIENPFEILKNFQYEKVLVSNEVKEELILPLYSERTGEVHEKSGLNQWNASGRKRDPNEVYIPISAALRRQYPNFFPERDTIFQIELPNGEKLVSKVCQENSKALMSNPNKALGKWLLRDVLNIPEGILLTRETLQIKGFDSLIIKKVGHLEYKLNVYLNK